MPSLSHLLQREPEKPVFQMDFGDKLAAQIASELAQEAADRLAPYIQALLIQAQESAEAGRLDGEVIRDAIEAAKASVEASVASKLDKVGADIQKAVNALRHAQESGAESVQKAVADAFSRIEMPDHSDELTMILSKQAEVLAAVRDSKSEPVTEWDLTVNRNRNGFIQSVKAKAK